MIVYADNKLKNEVKYIWKTCFHDETDEFIHFYLKEKYKTKTLWFIFRKEKLFPVCKFSLMP